MWSTCGGFLRFRSRTYSGQPERLADLLGRREDERPQDLEGLIAHRRALLTAYQDEDYARNTGAPSVFAMGMLPAGYLAHAVSDWFGGPQHLRRFRVRFTTRSWPGDEIVCTGKVDSIEDNLVRVRIEARRRGEGPDGLNLDREQVALTGEADVELPD